MKHKSETNPNDRIPKVQNLPTARFGHLEHSNFGIVSIFDIRYSNFKTQSGFTLIELLLVIAIIGILATFSLANYATVKQRARDTQRKSDLHQIQSALEFYRTDAGSYPGSVSCGGTISYVGSTYMQKVPCDPLNTTQSYKYSSNGTTYTLTACLENSNDSQGVQDATDCPNTSNNWAYQVTNPN